MPLDSPTTTTAAPSAPNIVLILTDDMRWDFLKYMPQVRQDLVFQGVKFANAFVVNSLCCPSRTAILTGNYSHTTGVYTNAPPHGGWPVFHARGEESSTIATWLHGAGYFTGLIGKYLNAYGPNNLFIPPGWDRWDAFDQGNASYYNYDLNVDGTIVHHGNAPPDYSTDVLAGDASDFIRSAPSSQPLFLYFAPFAPHAQVIPAPRDVGVIRDGPDRWPPNFNEADMSDKPLYLRNLPFVDPTEAEKVYVRTIEALLAVDDAVHQIVQALADTGRLANTMIVFSSDNGVLLGEHRLLQAKQVPYEESIRVPLVVRYDPVTAGTSSTRSQLVANIDFAPTFAQAAGLTPPNTDGTSFLQLVSNPSAPWRKDFLVEHLRDSFTAVPTYCAVRTPSRLFAHYNSGFEEYYNLRLDPFELANRVHLPVARATVDRLRSVLRRLCTPLPPGMRPF